MNAFLFFRYGIRMLYFFSYLVKEYKYWKQSTNTANIVLLSDNQIAYIFRVSDNNTLSKRWILLLVKANVSVVYLLLFFLL